MVRGRRVYADYAPLYAEYGLRVVPTGHDNGKKPLIRSWATLGKRAMRRLAKQYPDANLGVIDGDNGGIVVVDVDDAKLIDEAITHFGRTPLISETPSGGYHLWYRSSGERRQIKVGGKAIDLCGVGGFHLAPPSVHPDDGEYEFVEGDLTLIPNLPTLAVNSCPDIPVTGSIRPIPGKLSADLPWGGTGRRNTDLFRWAIPLAATCASQHDLLARLAAKNNSLPEPLPRCELDGIAGSLWRYKTEGRLMLPGCEAMAVVPKSQAADLSNDALALLVRLKHHHGWRRGRPFVLTNTAAKCFGLSRDRFRRARDELKKTGRIQLVWRGGKGPKDPPRFVLES